MNTNGDQPAWVSCLAADWGVGNEIGARDADALILRMRHEHMPTLLGHTVRAMIAEGFYGAIEVGFFHRLAEIALRGD